MCWLGVRASVEGQFPWEVHDGPPSSAAGALTAWLIFGLDLHLETPQAGSCCHTETLIQSDTFPSTVNGLSDQEMGMAVQSGLNHFQET